MTARELATRVLLDAHRRGYRELKAHVDRALDRAGLSAQERRLSAELVYGVVRWKRRLDGVVNTLAKRPDRVSNEARCILRLGIYQLLLMDGIPPHAAVHETVEMTRLLGVPHGFVNALLRAVQREGDPLRYPARDKNPVEHLGLRYSYPDWLVRRWIRAYGLDEAEEICVSHNARAPLTLRVNTVRTSRSELIAELSATGAHVDAGQFASTAIVTDRLPSLSQYKPFIDGLFTVQDESSQLVTELLDPQPGEVVLDVCAGPGGKTTHVAQRMGDVGRVVATDASEAALNKVRENTVRLGTSCVEFRVGDARDLIPDMIEQADRVLVDAPCSAHGILRRHAEARWLKQGDDPRSLARSQMEILEATARHVRPGGVMVYGVCTDTPDETIQVVRRFQRSRPDFEVEPSGEFLDSLPENAYTKTGAFVLMPHRHGTDGFYAVRFRRN